MGRLDGKVAIITGGNKGIGKTTAELFCKEGASVAIVATDKVAGLAVEEEIRANGGDIRFWQMDVRYEEQVNAVFAQIKDHFGRIDILVNNAGLVGVNKPIEETTVEEFAAPWEVDVKGLFICTKQVLPYMKSQGGGNIVNLSSITGLMASSGTLLPYHSAKGAVSIMTKNLAITLAPYGIRCNAVCPGTTMTPLIIDLGSRSEGGLEGYKARLGAKHPLGLGEPVDVAYAIVYLASDEAKQVTGVLLPVDGGFVAGKS